MASTSAAASKKRKHDELRSEEDDDDSSSASSSSSDEEEQEEQEEPKALQIVVRRVGKSEKDSLEVELPDAANATVLDLKHKISEALQEADEADIPHDRQRLIYAGKMLRDDSQSLQDDLKMKQQDGKKLFVHLTPLPKGVTPSVRTARELSENPAAQQQQRVAASATRRRRRHSSQSSRPGMSDPAAYHPYALDLSSGSLVPAAVAAAQQPPPADDAAALLSAAVAAVTEQQTREQQLRDLRNRINLDNIPVDVLARAVVLSFRMDQPTAAAQPLQNSSLTSLLGGAAAAPAQGGNAAAIASEISRLLAPQQQQQQQPSTMDLLENSLQETPTLASLLRQAQPQQVPTVAAESIPSLAAATSTDALLANNPAVSSLLQELMARQGTPTVATAATNNSGELAQMLDQIAANAGELATAVRQMGVETTNLTTAAARLPSTPVAPVVVSAATTPQNAAAAALIEQLSAAPQPPSAQASLLDRLAASASLSQPAATTANAASLIEQLTAAAQPPPAAPTTASLLEQLTAPTAAASSLVEQLSAPTASQASLLGQLSTTSPSNIDVAALLGQAQAQPIAAAAADATLQRRALEEQLATMLQPGAAATASLGFLPF